MDSPSAYKGKIAHRSWAELPPELIRYAQLLVIRRWIHSDTPILQARRHKITDCLV